MHSDPDREEKEARLRRVALQRAARREAERRLRESQRRKPIARGVSLFWTLALGAVSAIIFANATMWWQDALGYLVAFLAFGAFLELIKRRR